jgi:hypothetical protein
VGTSQLQVEWTTITGASVASLKGTVDETATADIVAIVRVAHEQPRVVINLADVTEIDEPGLILLEGMSSVANVAVIELSQAVIDLMHDLGHLAF